ncbi:MAG: hypothetical protein WBE72_02905 [Terracidiphilus sp.]
MAWRDLKAQLMRGHFTLALAGRFGQAKTVSLVMEGVPQSQILTFTSLGTGSMKRVVRIVGHDWVLAIAGDSDAAEADMLGEVKTLQLLGTAGVKVPMPFTEASPQDLLFKLTIHNQDMGEMEIPCFLQEFLPRTAWVEMVKLEGAPGFAKSTMVTDGIVPGHIGTTVTRLAKILDQMKVTEWGDFQIMYNKIDGEVVVFDPLPANTSGKSFIPLVEGWLRDIQEAKDAALKKTVGHTIVQSNLAQANKLV